MEGLHHYQPPHPAGNHFSRLPSFNIAPLSGIAVEDEGGGDTIHVAVGKLVGKSEELLQWTFRKFGNREICLLHVHQPSSSIPTLLGKLPVRQANEEVVNAHRREERKDMEKLLTIYSNMCSTAQVKATIVITESSQIHKGIIELVNMHSVKKLVMGASVAVNCMKVKNTSKANYAARNAPPFCEIWFVNRGKHVWTRDASENLNIFMHMLTSAEHAQEERLRLKSCYSQKSEQTVNPTLLRLNSCPSGGVRNPIQEDSDQLYGTLSTNESSVSGTICRSTSNQNGPTSGSGYTSAGLKVLPGFDSELHEHEQSCYDKMAEARKEGEMSKNEAFNELLKGRRLEFEAVEAINKVKAFEASHACEVQRRKEVEYTLRSTREEHKHVLEQQKAVSRELQETLRNVAFLESRIKEANCSKKKAARELELIQMSLTKLQHEGQNMQRQKDKAQRQLEWWRSRQARTSNCGGFGFVNSLAEYTEFSLFDLETATCNFSNSFIIGQGCYGCVYKGEIFDRSIAIKKLHPHNMEGISEFQQEVEALSKLKHHRLVTLIGACPEAWSLVYEYLPNGSIQDHLFGRTHTPLTWKTRTRIIAGMSSALFYLHSFTPQEMIHGDLKPENILLDSEFNCKIGDIGIGRLVPKKTARCPSFRGITEMNSAFPYVDPEFQKPGDLTPKSDIYAFGVIILQLLTGRSPVGLVNEVRRSTGNLTSILDPSAGEWPTFVAGRLVELGLQCCELKSGDRPELKPALVKELKKLHLTEEQVVPSFFLCPILQELMHDPQIVADGSTYEGEAIRKWLNSGRETSPMTNQPLSHTHLTPNRALRRAIEDWLRQS